MAKFMRGFLSLSEAGELMGIDPHARQDRVVRRRLTALEKMTGRTIMVSYGEGTRTRHLVAEAELKAAFGWGGDKEIGAR
jgi:hypothetical protein